MNQIAKSQFDAATLALLEQVARSGEPLIVTDEGVAVFEIRPCPKPEVVVDRESVMDMLRGSILHYDDPFEPVAEDDWDVLK